MPNRWISLFIVSFWLVMMTWLTVKEGWPSLHPRPSLQAALAESVNSGSVHWKVFQDGEKLGDLTTQVTITERRSYELIDTLQIENIKLGELFLGEKVGFRFLACSEVNQNGKFIRFAGDISFGDDKNPFRLKVVAVLDGKELLFKTTGFLSQEFRIPYERDSMILTSLCPLDRMPDIRLGQMWEAPMFDPVSIFLTNLMERPSIIVQVLPERQALKLGPNQNATCYLVDGKQSNMSLKIWVRIRDNMVMKQSARWGNSTIDIVRDEKGAKPGKTMRN